MIVDFSSLTLLYVYLKNLLLTDAGMTVEREIGQHDCILSYGGGKFLRIRKCINGQTGSIDLQVGSNADTLFLNTDDPELCFPFSMAGGQITVSADWIPDPKILSVFIRSLQKEHQYKSYRFDFNLKDGWRSGAHYSPHNQSQEPNFKLKGGAFFPIGA